MLNNKKQLAMKTKKFIFDLDCKFAVYVPSTLNVNESTDNSIQVKEVLKELSTLFGGATATEAFGAWVCDNGELVTEKVTIVYSFCTSEQAREHIQGVVKICEELKKEMNQESITLEYNGQVKFI